MATIEEAFQELMKTSKDLLEEDGNVEPGFFFLTEQKDKPGTFAMAIAKPDFSSEEAKDFTAAAVRKLARKIKPDGMLFVSEAWKVVREGDAAVEAAKQVESGIKPSQMIDRQEVVQFVIETAGKIRLGHVPILREEGKQPTIDLEALEWRDDALETWGGRFTRILPQNRKEEIEAEDREERIREQMAFMAKTLGKAMQDAEERLGLDHPIFGKFTKLLMTAMTNRTPTLEDKRKHLEAIKELYREATGGEMPAIPELEEELNRKENDD